MATESGPAMNLRNDTAINVVGLLKASIGSGRSYDLRLDRFVLDDELAAEEIVGDVRLTRLRDGVMARVRAGGRVHLECARCLRAYDQPFVATFAEEYRQTVDVRSGIGLNPGADDDEETSRIDENHELDLADVLRQEIVVVLPMRPDCGGECPGPDPIAGGADPTASGDDRFAALAGLLQDDQSVDDGDYPTDHDAIRQASATGARPTRVDRRPERATPEEDHDGRPAETTN